MKKTGLACVLICLLLLTLCGCSAYSGIKIAYGQAGYREYTITEDIKTAFGIEEKDCKSAAAVVHFLSTAEIDKEDDLTALTDKAAASKWVIVWEYSDEEALQEAYKHTLAEEELTQFDKLWSEYRKAPTVSGNCVLVRGDTAIFEKTR